MTREDVKKWLPILQALAEDKTIQKLVTYADETQEWQDETNADYLRQELFNLIGHTPREAWRVKPIYRPFKDCEELVAEYCKRFGVERKAWEMPNIWVRMKNTRFNTCVLIVEMDDKGVARFASTITWQDLMDGYTFLDGSSCGVMEETQA